MKGFSRFLGWPSRFQLYLSFIVVLIGMGAVPGDGSAGVIEGKPAPDLSRVVLDAETRESRRWKVLGSAAQGRHGSRRPCLDVSIMPLTEDPLGVSIESESCRTIEPVPNMLAVVDDAEKPRLLVVAMMLSPKVSKVQISLKGRGITTALSEHLSAYKRLKSHIHDVAYVARAFVGKVCVRRIRALSRTGELVYDGGLMACSAE